MRSPKAVILFILFFACFQPAYAQEAVLKPRTVLALFDSSETYNRTEDNNMIHNNAEMVLNYLGLKVRYHDMNQGLPPEEALEDVLGILSWFRDGELANAEAYCEWAAEQIRAGKKFVVIDDFGAFWDKNLRRETEPRRVNNFFQALGLEYRGNWTDNPLVIGLAAKDSEMVEFERTLDEELELYEQIVLTDFSGQSYLQLTRTDLPRSTSDVVTITSRGGFALGDYAVFFNYLNDSVRWRVNPFLFFEKALGLEGVPKFDTTTLLGKRILYSHIDGDGLRNTTEVDASRLAGEIIRDEIIAKYPLPTTVSFVTAEIDPQYFGTDRTLALARSLLSFEHVEAGAHAFSHPLDWEKQITSFKIKGYSKPLSFFEKEALEFSSEANYADGFRVTKDRKEYLKREIEGAVKFLNENVVPKGRGVKIYQWSGNCEPPAEALDLVQRLNLRNINRGDSRFDRAIPSFTGLAPLTRQIEGRTQIQTSNANENIYTHGWDGPYDRYLQVMETIEQTERPVLVKAPPRRLTPINLYYHFFIGEKKASLNALKRVCDDVLRKNVIPIFTSEYAGLVEDFLKAKIRERPDGGWEFEDYGRAKTVRLDASEGYPDLGRSKGILGFAVWENFLYVHLGEGPRAVLYLAAARPREAYLREASAAPTEWTLAQDRFSFSTQGFGKMAFQIANLQPGMYEIQIREGSQAGKAQKERVTTQPNGDLNLSLKARGLAAVSGARV